MPEWHDVPEEPLTPAALVAESQSIMARNAAKANARANLTSWKSRPRHGKRLRNRLTEIKAMLGTGRKGIRAYCSKISITDEIQAQQFRLMPTNQLEEIERKLG